MAASDALVATDPDGAPVATFLRRPGRVHAVIEVRDETSAPVATLVRSGAETDADWQLVETGGAAVAELTVADRDFDGAIDDEWSLHALAPDTLPLSTLGAVALLLAAKCLLGRPSPTPTPDRRTLADADNPGMFDIGDLL